MKQFQIGKLLSAVLNSTRKRRFAMTPRMILIAWGCLSASTAMSAAQTTTPPVPIHEVLFSTDPSSTYPMPILRFTPGDLVSERGYVVATNGYLLRNFHPILPPSPKPLPRGMSYGLDAIHEIRLLGGATARPAYLFSVSDAFADDVLGVEITDGDLLCDNGRIVATNAQLMQNFHPMPPTPNVGLDAVCLPNYRIAVDAARPPEIWFSAKVGFFDERLGVQISGGDLLSTTGRVVATNRWLIRNFHPMPPVADMGLDAAFVPQWNPRINSATVLPEIWFSTDRGWYDEVLRRAISAGDLLSSNGRVVRTNAQLLRAFGVTTDLGLDAVHVRPARCDFNLDGSVDLYDFVRLQSCFNGPNQPVTAECADTDVDDDGDADLADFTQLQATFTGPVAQP